ncbi:hypothetical protein PVAP13_5KG089200 [Panicum virgatum]|uniref:Uncharacterized protein n=1 Tax=Panicum virgatum TaxID=38727 RepID=A0A8T0SBN9_PANVG|nr:hypothetical protein PVAP13_5KG089200 [Panicum virgatum]
MARSQWAQLQWPDRPPPRPSLAAESTARGPGSGLVRHRRPPAQNPPPLPDHARRQPARADPAPRTPPRAEPIRPARSSSSLPPAPGDSREAKRGEEEENPQP